MCLLYDSNARRSVYKKFLHPLVTNHLPLKSLSASQLPVASSLFLCYFTALMDQMSSHQKQLFSHCTKLAVTKNRAKMVVTLHLHSSGVQKQHYKGREGVDWPIWTSKGSISLFLSATLAMWLQPDTCITSFYERQLNTGDRRLKHLHCFSLLFWGHTLLYTSIKSSNNIILP